MDIWFISYYLGAAILPVYYVAVRLVEYALQFMQQATNLSGPIFTEYYVKGETAQLNRSFSLFLKTNIIFGTTVLTGFYILGYGFIELWMKGSVSTESAYTCLLIVALGRFMAYFTTPVQSLLMTINRHRLAAWVAVGETILSIVLCILLIPAFGIIGASIAVASPYIVGRLFVLPFIIAKFVEINLISTAKRVLFYVICSGISAVIIKQYCLDWHSINLIELIVWGAIVVFLQILLSLLIWNTDERQWMFTFIKEKLNNTLIKE